MKKEEYSWSSDLDPIFYDQLNKDALLFCFQQAEKRLTHALQITDKLVTRTYAWISGLIPIFSISLWVITRRAIKADTNDPIANSLFIISIYVTIVSLILLLILMSAAFPKKLPVIGREPSHIVKSDYLLNPKFSGANSLYLIVIYELEEYESRIQLLNESNERRIFRLNIVFNITRIIIICYVLAILTIYLLSNFI